MSETPRFTPAPMTFAYADPPYLGMGQRYYAHLHAEASLWDDPATHRQLIVKLCDEYPDGWAMSAHSPSLRILLPMCPADVRVAAWVKSFCAFKKGVRPCYAWEPVIFRGGRNANHPPPPKDGYQTTPKDFFVAPIAMEKGLTGAKPPEVCRWILDLLNFQDSDTLVDLFPGTGAMTRVANNLPEIDTQLVFAELGR